MNLHPVTEHSMTVTFSTNPYSSESDKTIRKAAICLMPLLKVLKGEII